MKPTLSLLACVFVCAFAHAQNLPRNATLHPIGKDSINMVMNDRYNVVDDSCATIVRYGHYNFSTHKFFGKFKDISKVDPSLVRTEGSYTADGMKDGEFIARYGNGNILAKGSYKNNKYIGKWEIDFRNGKPEINFEADDAGNIKIMDVWNNKGVKIIDNGKGAYQVNMGSITWKGDLADGYPDGLWTAINRNTTSQDILISEKFKKGKFQGGKSQAGSYSDESHMILIDQNLLPYVFAEEMIAAPNGCDAPKKQARITNAKLTNGSGDFREAIRNIVAPYLATVDYKQIENEVSFTGTISSEGIPGNFKCTTLFDPKLSDGIINRLIRLPAFVPATLNNKAVPQDVSITFKFHQGVYGYSYKLMPIKQD